MKSSKEGTKKDASKVATPKVQPKKAQASRELSEDQLEHVAGGNAQATIKARSGTF